jgi:hypothetical protein
MLCTAGQFPKGSATLGNVVVRKSHPGPGGFRDLKYPLKTGGRLDSFMRKALEVRRVPLSPRDIAQRAVPDQARIVP